MQFELINMSGDDGQSLTVYIPEREFVKSVRSDNENYAAIRKLVMSYAARDDQGENLTAEENDNLITELNLAEAIARRFERLSDRFTVRGGVIYKDGDALPKDDPWVKQVMRFRKEGVEDWRPLIAFADKLDANPNEHSRKQFFNFLNLYPITITEDGDVVLYKGVNQRTPDDENDPYVYQSCSGGPDTIVDNEVQPNGKVKQGIGSVVEHPRSLVHFDPSMACSNGLHCGTYDYCKGIGSVRLRVLINPRDVVNVPSNDHKVRVCRYVILDEASPTPATEALLVAQHVSTKDSPEAPSEPSKADPSVDEGDDAAVLISEQNEAEGTCDCGAWTDEECECSYDEDDEFTGSGHLPTDEEMEEIRKMLTGELSEKGQLEEDLMTELPKRKRYPSPGKWDEIQAERKARKKGMRKLGEREGWILEVEDMPNERKSWVVGA